MTTGTKRVELMRSKEGNREPAASLLQAGFEAIAIDTLSFPPPRGWEAVENPLGALRRNDRLLFTSGVGTVYFFMSRKQALLLDFPTDGQKVATIGPAPQTYTFESLIEELGS
jgi:uroporphyrinogen-III synthase